MVIRILVNICEFDFHIRTVHFNIITVFFYSPTNAQVNCFKISFKIYIKSYIKTATTCFGAVTPSPGSALLVLAKVTVVKIANYGTSVLGTQGKHDKETTDI
jgi:hypothetical protein